MANIISSNTAAATSQANKIKGKAAPLGSSTKVSGGSGTNLAVNTRCQTCFNQKSSMLSAYAAQTQKDASNLAKIAQSFEALDRKVSSQVRKK